MARVARQQPYGVNGTQGRTNLGPVLSLATALLGCANGRFCCKVLSLTVVGRERVAGRARRLTTERRGRHDTRNDEGESEANERFGSRVWDGPVARMVANLGYAGCDRRLGHEQSLYRRRPRAGSRRDISKAQILAQGLGVNMVLIHLLVHGFGFALVANGYLLLMMVTTSPRIWGYHDYPEVVRAKVPIQTGAEKLKAGILGVPWLIFVLAFPVYSTYVLHSSLGGDIPFLVAVLNPLVLLQMTNLGDMLILDWLIVSRMTPRFVIIPGSTADDYKDMSHHFRGHVRASAIIVLLSVVIGVVVYTI